MTEKWRTMLIALGSNENSVWGNCAETVQMAIENVARGSFTTARTSNFYATPAFPAGSGPDYVNAAMTIESDLTPAAMLAELHAIEASAGRQRGVRWGQRTLDIDLIACEDAVLPDAGTYAKWRDLPAKAQAATAPRDLVLPHPRMQDRAFVLVPLADVAPDWRHPVSGRTVLQMLAALTDDQVRDVVRLDP